MVIAHFSSFYLSGFGDNSNNMSLVHLFHFGNDNVFRDQEGDVRVQRRLGRCWFITITPHHSRTFLIFT